MGSFFAFLKSKPFFIHLAVSLVSVILVLIVLIKSLSSYTDHGEYVEVPDFSDIRVSDLENFASGKEIQFQIVDSIYDPARKTGVVIKQEPFPNSKVKHNRTIYLYVTSMVAPQITMPKLIDRSERQARLLVLSYGLKVGKITTQSADCNGCVIAQQFKGENVEPGAPIKKGSVIDLIIGVKDGSYVPADSLSDKITNETPSFDVE
jgi:beta-lactam-binding protein with PASTA domain